MAVYPTDKIRNVVLCGHSGCGKTTLAETMLFEAKAIPRRGNVGEGNTQSDYANNPNSYDVDYWLIEAGLGAHGFKLLGGIESLEGDGTNRFQTPLATLHKYQGYADVFLVTPANGIVDTYGTLAYETKLEDAGPVTGAMAAVTYHEYQAERGSTSYGSETDFEVVARLGDNWSAGVKYADFNSDAASFKERDKLWLTVEFNY